MPKLEQFEIKKYWQIFSGLKPVENKVSHDQVLPILYNSKQDSSILNKIWFLADIDDDDNLDFEEFVICMRLIFDMVNKNIESVPDELPDWLIPGSKAKLVKERKKIKQEENADIPKAEPVKVDWYISPEDMKQYEQILASCGTSTDGTVTFSALSVVLKNKFFNIGSRDMEKTWKLVNPKNMAGIDKDPALYFIHALRQCNDVGAVIPSELPRALAEVCNKQRVQYDMKSEQAQVKRTSEAVKPQKQPLSNGTQNQVQTPSLVNTSTTADIKLDSNISHEKARQIREQLEGLLNYKKALSTTTSSSNINVRTFTDDLDNIEQQVQLLENYLKDKKIEYESIQKDIQAAR